MKRPTFTFNIAGLFLNFCFTVWMVKRFGWGWATIAWGALYLVDHFIPDE